MMKNKSNILLPMLSNNSVTRFGEMSSFGQKNIWKNFKVSS